MALIFFEPSFLQSILLLFIGLTSVVVAYFKYSFTYWRRKGVPSLPASIPFGNCKDNILCKLGFGLMWKQFYEIFKNCGKPYAGIYMFTKPVLLILHPDLAKQILTKDFQYFTAREIYCDEDENDPLNGSLLSLYGLKWRNLRNKLSPTFTSAKIKTMFHVLVSSSVKLEEILTDYSKNNVPIDIKDFMGNFTTDVIGTAVLGLENNSIKYPDNELRRIGKRITNLTFSDACKVLISNNFPGLYKFIGIKKIPKFIDDFFMGVITETVAYREKNNIALNDFLQLLIQLKNKGKYILKIACFPLGHSIPNQPYFSKN